MYRRERESVLRELELMRAEEKLLRMLYTGEAKQRAEEREAMRVEEDRMKTFMEEEKQIQGREIVEMQLEDVVASTYRIEEHEARQRESELMWTEEQRTRRVVKQEAVALAQQLAMMMKADAEARAFESGEKERRLAEMKLFEQEDTFGQHWRTFLSLVNERTRQLVEDQKVSNCLDLSSMNLEMIDSIDPEHGWISVDLSQNRLTLLPRLPPTAKKINVAHNKLTCLRLNGSYADLEQLDIGSNSLRSLEALTRGAPNLLCLNLCSNKLSDGISLQNQRRLVSLDISGNGLERVDWVSISEACPLLQFLDLSSNQLKYGPNGLQLRMLMTFYLRNNDLTSYLESSSSCKVPLLETLDLSWNEIKSLDPHVFAQAHPALRSVNLSHNSLTSYGEVAIVKSVCPFLCSINIEGNSVVQRDEDLASAKKGAKHKEEGFVYALLRGQLKQVEIRDSNGQRHAHRRIGTGARTLRGIVLAQAMARGMSARGWIRQALRTSEYEGYDEEQYKSVDVDSFLDINSASIPEPIVQEADDGFISNAWAVTKAHTSKLPLVHGSSKEGNLTRHEDDTIIGGLEQPLVADQSLEVSNQDVEKSTIASDGSQLSSRSYESGGLSSGQRSGSHRFVVERRRKKTQHLGKSKTVTHDIVLRDRLNNRKANAGRRKAVPAWAQKIKSRSSWLPPIRSASRPVS